MYNFNWNFILFLSVLTHYQIFHLVFLIRFSYCFSENVHCRCYLCVKHGTRCERQEFPQDDLYQQGVFSSVCKGRHKLKLSDPLRSPVGFQNTQRAKSCIKTWKIKYVFDKGRRKEGMENSEGHEVVFVKAERW